MLTPDLINAVKEYAKRLTQKVTFVLSEPKTPAHEDREELVAFLNDLAATSENLELTTSAHPLLSSDLSFTLKADSHDTGIVFSGIPGGHEFSSLVLAILQAGGGSELKIDASIIALLKGVTTPLNFQTYVSLSCHNCPDVVQVLNQFALVNPLITHEMIEGGAFQALIEERNIQGVPSVYLNGEGFANGKIDTAKIIDKLLAQYPEIAQSGPSEQLPTQDVTVIGGGPAGAAAAIYAARKGIKVTLIADRIGGQVKDTMDIENFVSVQLTNGQQLSGDLHEHLLTHEITLKEGVQVKQLSSGSPLHQIVLNTGEQIESKTVIIASGAKWRDLGVPGEKENIGNGVAYCPHCDGPFFKGKPVAVIGGGNSGVEAALDLAGIVDHVTVFEFMPELKADQILVNKLHERSNVSVITNAATKQINAANGKVTGLTYTDRATDAEQNVDVAAVFVQIGLVPNAQFVEEGLERTQHGEIIVNERCQTNIPGIFACGDVSTVPYKQIIIAMGEGSKAALAAFDYLIKL